MMKVKQEMNSYTAYVYLWYDTKAKFFYIGGHQGQVEDNYVCSNRAMKAAYMKRPETFKFRVLEYVNGSVTMLREAEQRWLDKIKDEELYWTPNIYAKTTKYYNQKKVAYGGSSKGKKKISNKIGGHNRFTWTIEDPFGVIHTTDSFASFSKLHNLDKGTLFNAFSQNRPVKYGKCVGWKILGMEKAQ